MDEGTCRTCGYLCTVANGQAPVHLEVSVENRASGSVAVHCVSYPVACLRRAADLQQEHFEAMCNGVSEQAAFVEVIGRDRGCQQWFEYMPGLSPSEHLQEQRMHWAQKMSVEQSERFERERKESETKERRWNRGAFIVVTGLAIIQILAAGKDSLVGSLLQRLFSW